MADLKSDLTEHMKQAMKNKDKFRLGVIRMMLSEVKRFDIDNPEKANNTAEQTKIVAAYHKNLTKSVSDFPPEKQEVIKSEIAIVEEFLPKQLGDEEIRAAASEIIAQSEDKKFGPLMKALSQKLAGKADGKKVSSILKEMLP